MEADEGKADEVAPYLIAVRDSAISDAEPGTLTYRLVRYKDTFALFEE